MRPSRFWMANPKSAIRNPKFLVNYLYSVYRVPRRHVGKNDCVSDIQTFNNLNRIHRAAAQLDLRANRFTAWRHLENRDRAVGLSVRGSADVEHIVEFRNLNRSVDAQ